MTGELDHTVPSAAEIEAISLLERAYLSRARNAADALSRSIELDDHSRNQLIGQLALKLGTLDFLERQKVDEALRQLTALLGGMALETSLPPVLTVAEDLKSDTGLPTPPVQQIELPPLPQSGVLAETAGADPVELTSSQKTWLKKLFGQESLAKITSLNKQALNELTENIVSAYLTLQSKRLTPAIRSQRIAALRSLMDGQSYKEIAKDLDANYFAVFNNLSNMATMISSQLPREEIMVLIPQAEIVETETKTEPSNNNGNEAEDNAVPAEVVALAPDQVRWFRALLKNDEAVAAIKELSPTQQFHLAERLGHRLDPLLRPKVGAEITRTRVERMKDFIKGKTLEEIALERGMSVEGCRDDLLKSANTLSTRTPSEDLLQLIEEAGLTK